MALEAPSILNESPFASNAAVSFRREQGGVEMRFARHYLRAGFSLLRSEASPKAAGPTPFELALNPVHCHLGALVKGSLQVELSDARPMASLGEGDWFVATGEKRRVLKIRAGGPLRLFTIETDRAQMESFFRQSDPENEWLVEDLCQLADQRPRFLSGPATATLNRLARNIDSEQAENFAARLRLESLVLRWLAELLVLPQLRRDPTCADVCPTGDRSAILAAARFLEENLGEKHSTARLSRQVHLNEFKLKRGFRTFLGTSIMGYLRSKRMEHAARLLSKEAYSVLDVAGMVGYENPSQFARAFRIHHGLPPKRFQQDLHGRRNSSRATRGGKYK